MVHSNGGMQTRSVSLIYSEVGPNKLDNKWTSCHDKNHLVSEKVSNDICCHRTLISIISALLFSSFTVLCHTRKKPYSYDALNRNSFVKYSIYAFEQDILLLLLLLWVRALFGNDWYQLLVVVVIHIVHRPKTGICPVLFTNFVWILVVDPAAK